MSEDECGILDRIQSVSPVASYSTSHGIPLLPDQRGVPHPRVFLRKECGIA